jgi:hypothetical protein
MPNWIPDNFPSMLVDLSLKVLLLAVVAWVAMAAVRMHSESVKHRVWTIVVLGMLLLPTLVQVVPIISLPAWLYPDLQSVTAERSADVEVALAIGEQWTSNSPEPSRDLQSPDTEFLPDGDRQTTPVPEANPQVAVESNLSVIPIESTRLAPTASDEPVNPPRDITQLFMLSTAVTRPAVSYSCPIFMRLRHFDFETGIQDSDFGAPRKRNVGRFLWRQRNPFWNYSPGLQRSSPSCSAEQRLPEILRAISRICLARVKRIEKQATEWYDPTPDKTSPWPLPSHWAWHSARCSR